MRINLTLMSPVYKSPNRNKKTLNTVSVQSLVKSTADTVSFGSGKSHEEKILEELQNTFDETILPFMNKNKELYKQVGQIGYTSQNALKSVTDFDNNFKRMQIELINNEAPNSELKKYLDIADRCSVNIGMFDKLSDLMKKSSMYQNSGKLKGEWVKTELLFRNCNETKKLADLKKFADVSYDNTMRAFFNITLKNTEPELYDKFAKTSRINQTALYYLMSIPYQDGIYLQKEIKTTKENLHVPKEHWYDNYKMVEKLSNTTKDVLKGIDFTEKVLPNVTKFVNDNKDCTNLYPTDSELKTAYQKMEDTCKKIQAKKHSDLVSYFNENYKNKDDEINLGKADMELELQEAALEKVNKLMLDIKTEYIKKLNETIIVKHPASEFDDSPKQ